MAANGPRRLLQCSEPLTAILAAALASCGLLPGPSVPADLELIFNVAESGRTITSPDEPIFREQPIFETVEGKVGSHAATVTSFPDGELLAAWYAYDGPHELDGSAIFFARLPVGSAAWTPPELHIDRPEGDGNPVLYSEADRVWLFQAVVPFGWSTARIETQVSSDRGTRWSAPTRIPGPIGSNTRFGPIRTTNGMLLLPAYDDLFPRALFFVSTDGQDWMLRSTLDSGTSELNIQPSVARLENDRLLTVMRNTGGNWLWVAASADDGGSWSAPVDSGFANPGSPSALLKLASGHLLLVFNDSPTERRPLSVALSADDGVTWPHRRVLVDGPDTYSYPSVVQTPDGLIHIVFSFGRQHIQHITVNQAWIVALEN